jgi:pimeloyl-ACP methyl ester carboxylesterase
VSSTSSFAQGSAFGSSGAEDFAARALAQCEALPKRALRSPWWASLPEDFASEPEPFRLEGLERAQVGSAACSDVVLRTLGACLVGSLALPLGYHPARLLRSLREHEEPTRAVEGGDASRFYRPPPTDVALVRRPASHPLFSPDDGECEDVRFDSPYLPYFGSERTAYLANDRNRMAHARHWRHRRGPRATVIAIHGFSADLYHFNEWFFAIPWLYKAGYDVLLFTLPFHGARQSRLSPFSGHGFFSGGPLRINEAFGQAICDLRVFLGALLAEGVPRVGVTGMSLGGLTTSLFASVEPRLSFAIPNVPVVSIADLVMEWEPIASYLRAAMRLSGQNVRIARELLAPSSPLSFRPALPRERLFLIGGVGDRLAPPRHARLLWEHWDRPRLHWFPGSHVIHLDRGAYFRAMRGFFSDIGFSP